MADGSCGAKQYIPLGKMYFFDMLYGMGILYLDREMKFEMPSICSLQTDINPYGAR